MYEIKNATFIPENAVAGDFPMKTDFGEIKNGAKIHKYAPIIKGENGIEEITAAMLPTTGENATAGSLDKLIGIAADEPCGNEVVYYLTGEFFAEALYMPTGVTAEVIKPVLRNMGIYLKEMNNNG